MISTSQLCKRRKIKTVDLSTPMLVPSFSSKGFPEIGWIWHGLEGYLTDTALVSSYDIYYNYLEPEFETTNLLFIDSGGYEARKDHDLSEVYNVEYHPKPWGREQYLEVLGKLKTFPPWS